VNHDDYRAGRCLNTPWYLNVRLLTAVCVLSDIGALALAAARVARPGRLALVGGPRRGEATRPTRGGYWLDVLAPGSAPSTTAGRAWVRRRRLRPRSDRNVSPRR